MWAVCFTKGLCVVSYHHPRVRKTKVLAMKTRNRGVIGSTCCPRNDRWSKQWRPASCWLCKSVHLGHLRKQLTVTPSRGHNGLTNRKVIYLGPHQCGFIKQIWDTSIQTCKVKQIEETFDNSVFLLSELFLFPRSCPSSLFAFITIFSIRHWGGQTRTGWVQCFQGCSDKGEEGWDSTPALNASA